LTPRHHIDGIKPQIDGRASDGGIIVSQAVRGRREHQVHQSDTGIMATPIARIGIVGSGMAARQNLDRFLALDSVSIAGCADADFQGAHDMFTAVLTWPSVTTFGCSDPAVPATGVLADTVGDLIDVLLWSTGQAAHEVAAFQSRSDPDTYPVTAAAIRFADGTPVTFATPGASPESLFLLDFIGEQGSLRATDQSLHEQIFDAPRREIPLPAPAETIEGNFVAAITGETRIYCPADAAIDTVRLLDAIARSAATGQVVRLI
jgi:hypothetical protein